MEGAMTTLFVTEQGCRLVRRGYAILGYKNREKLFMYPLENIRQIVIMGRVEVSSSLLGLLMVRGVDTVFLSRYGRFKGRVSAGAGKNILIREKQFQRRSEPSFALQFCRSLVRAKILNSRNLIRKQRPNLAEEMKPRLENALRSIQRAGSLNALRGLEGAFATLYFQKFPQLLKETFGFTRRIKHPPPDPLNILFSLGYTLLFNSVYALVEAAGLDPYAGFFHQARYGHPALVSDLMEPYRAPLVDRLVIRLINNGKISKEHFRKGESRSEMEETALKMFISGYQERLFSRFSRNSVRETTWNLLQKDVWQFQKHLEGETDEFKPYIFR